MASKGSVQAGVAAEDLEEFVKSMTGGGKAYMIAEHDRLNKEERHVYYFMKNEQRNRYSNLMMFDQGAVLPRKEKETDLQYYHASRVTSKYGTYILAQAPTQESMCEWYRLIWQQNVHIIVCLENFIKRPEMCTPYFNVKKGKTFTVEGRFKVRTISFRQDGPISTYELKVCNLLAGKAERALNIVVFTKWQHNQVPEARKLINLMHNIWAVKQSMVSAGDADADDPLLVHGCAGVRRTSALVTILSVCKGIKDDNMVVLLSFIKLLRNMRYGAMRNKNCYAATLCTILQFSLDLGKCPPDTKQQVNAAIKMILDTIPEDETTPAGKTSAASKVSVPSPKGK